MISIAKRIELLRSLNYSDKEIARLLNVNPVTVWNWRNNDSWSESREEALGGFIKDLIVKRLMDNLKRYKDIYGEDFIWPIR